MSIRDVGRIPGNPELGIGNEMPFRVVGRMPLFRKIPKPLRMAVCTAAMGQLLR